MNYRHAFHAGNFADVVKHVALVSILLHLRKKQTPFAVIDSHAGRGLYDLAGDEARRTGEAEGGIARLADVAGAPPALGAYLELARADPAHYPGSPLIAAKLLRSQDRLVAIEKHPQDAAMLGRALASFAKARAECADGYVRLRALLPPQERRGLVLIDPPYESPDEFARGARALLAGIRRFANGIYLVWFPLKRPGDADAFCGEVLAAGVGRALRLDIDIGAGAEGQLSCAGLLIVNPPFGFVPEMEAANGVLAPLLGRKGHARITLAWLAGGD